MHMLKIPLWGRALIIGGSIVVVSGIKHFWKSYPADNVVEEFIEERIEDHIGADIDLTPFR